MESASEKTDDTIYYAQDNNPQHDPINNKIGDHIWKTFTDTDDLYWMSQSLLRDGYLKVSNLVSDSLKKDLNEEVYSLLSKHSKRRDIHVEVTGNSPRFMSNVRQQDITLYGEVLPAIYHSSHLISFLSTIAEEDIIPNP